MVSYLSDTILGIILSDDTLVTLSATNIYGDNIGDKFLSDNIRVVIWGNNI